MCSHLVFVIRAPFDAGWSLARLQPFDQCPTCVGYGDDGRTREDRRGRTAENQVDFRWRVLRVVRVRDGHLWVVVVGVVERRAAG